MSKTPQKYVTKSQLVTDYVTKREFTEFKREFHDFKDEMYDFRTETNKRFDSVDKKINNLERKIDDFRDEIRIEMGAWRDQLRSDFIVCVEYIKDIAVGRKNGSDPIPLK